MPGRKRKDPSAPLSASKQKEQQTRLELGPRIPRSEKVPHVGEFAGTIAKTRRPTGGAGRHPKSEG